MLVRRLSFVPSLTLVVLLALPGWAQTDVMIEPTLVDEIRLGPATRREDVAAGPGLPSAIVAGTGAPTGIPVPELAACDDLLADFIERWSVPGARRPMPARAPRGASS